MQDTPARGTPREEDCDVLVIGGGPAGSTVSALLREMGWRVLLTEKEQHPRFHIGESLLPMNMPILKELGVYDKVAAIGVQKNGIDFYTAEQPPHHTTIYFADAMDKRFPYAYQVRRSEFDHLLLENARAKGVDIREHTRIMEIESLAFDDCAFRASGPDGGELRITARYVIDASGRDAFLSRKLSLLNRNPDHVAAAVFSHFRNVPRRSGRDEGNIGLHWFDHGWFWTIPLKDGVTSIGAVCWPEYLKSRNGEDLDSFLWRTIRRAPTLNDLMGEAEMVAPAQGTGNYSYSADRVYGDGYLLLGDAFAFVDPVFSSGVYLAMIGAQSGAAAANAILRGAGDAPALFRKHERRHRHRIGVISWFIYRYNSPALRRLFMNPRNHFRIKEAVISVLAGDTFGDTPIRFPVFLFKLLYVFASLGDLRASMSFRLRRRRNNSQAASP